MSDAKEVIALLLILLVFAVVSASYVLTKGLEEGKRSKYLTYYHLFLMSEFLTIN
jgi:hypothetical protein